MTTKLFAPALTRGITHRGPPTRRTRRALSLRRPLRCGRSDPQRLHLAPAYDNLSAATDPSVSDNYTQYYSVGSRWFNTTASRAWTCLSAATGAAIWVLDGVVPGVGVTPSNMLTCSGSGLGTILSDGNLHRRIG
jgi:hypothetical protein